MENDYLKKLQALVQKKNKPTKKEKAFMKSPIIKIAMLLFGIILSVTVKAQIVTTNPVGICGISRRQRTDSRQGQRPDGRTEENRPFAEHHCRRVRADAPVGKEIQQLP